MMRPWAWIGCGFVAMSALGSLGALCPPAWTVPNAPVVVTVFAALRMAAGGAALVALGLGYLAGRAACAPPGLLELAHLGLGLLVFTLSGRLAGGGRLFFCLTAAAACLVVQALMAAWWALWWSTARPLWPTGSGSQALGTGLMAALAWRPLMALDRRLAGQQAEALGWR